MSLEATNLPQYKTPEDFQALANGLKTMLGRISAPAMIIAATGAAQDLNYDDRTPCVIILQNCSTNNVKWAIGSTATADSFHGIIGACSATDDGFGGILTLPGIRGERISLFSDGASKRIATWIMQY